MIVQVNAVPFRAEIQHLCCRRYPGHPRGCPNFGKKDTCPPKPLIDEVLDLTQPVYAIYTEFDLGAHAARMWAEYPDWSERQAYCCLYWQPRARAQHREEQAAALRTFYRDEPICSYIVPVPEAYGVDVTALMASIGVTLEWPPRKITRVVSLAGHRAERG